MSERAGNTDFEDFNPWSRFGNKKKKIKTQHRLDVVTKIWLFIGEQMKLFYKLLEILEFLDFQTVTIRE